MSTDDEKKHEKLLKKEKKKAKKEKKEQKKEKREKSLSKRKLDERKAEKGTPTKDDTFAAAKKQKKEGEAYNGKRYESFGDAPFDDAVITLLQQAFDQPSPIQSAAWPAACDGKDVIAVAKTGSGKTLAFLLPMFRSIGSHPVAAGGGPLGLVVAPTRELAVQIQAECAKFGACLGIASLCCYGGTPVHQQKRSLTTIHPHVVIGTPGRLQDLLNQEVLILSGCRTVVLDEADRMLDMGFEPQIKQLFLSLSPTRQVLLFSATWPKSVRKLAAAYLGQKDNVVEVFLGGGGGANAELEANKSISQTFIQATDDEKDNKMYKMLCDLEEDSRVVVFANTKRRVDMLARNFAEFGTCAVHGDKNQHDREVALKSFVDYKCPLMIATDVAARGLDIKGVTHVFNYDMARDVESYVHRIGRTGRAGEIGASVTFWNPDYDKECTPALCKIARDAGQLVPEWLEKYEKTKASKQWKVEKAVLTPA